MKKLSIAKIAKTVHDNALPISIAGLGSVALYDATSKSINKKLNNLGKKVSYKLDDIDNNEGKFIETPYKKKSKLKKDLESVIESSPIYAPLTASALTSSKDAIKLWADPEFKKRLRKINPSSLPTFLTNELKNVNTKGGRNRVAKAASLAFGGALATKYLYNRFNNIKVKSDRYYAIRYTVDEIIILKEFKDRDLAYKYKESNPGVVINKGSTLISKGFNKDNEES